MKTTILAVLALALVFASCKSSEQVKTKSEKTTSSLPTLDGNWQLTSVNGEAVKLGADEAFLSFNPDENTFFGKAGCNRFSGSARCEGNTLTFGAIMATKMFCPDNTLEDKLLAVLNDSSWTVVRTRSELTLKNGNQIIVLKKNK